MKAVLLTVLLIVLSTAVLADIPVNQGDSYEITQLLSCYGEGIVNVRGFVEIERGEYTIKDCQFKNVNDNTEDIWICLCADGQNFSVVLETTNETHNQYDIVTEHFIAPFDSFATNESPDDNIKRTQNFNNINVGPPPPPPPPPEEPFELPPVNSVFVIVALIAVFGMVLGGSYLLIRSLFSGEENQIEKNTPHSGYQKRDHKQKDDIEELLRKI